MITWDSFPNHLKETFFMLDFFFPRSHCKFFLLFYIRETCKWVILDLTCSVWGEMKYRYVRIPTSDFRWWIWNCPRFVLVFTEGEPSSVLSRVLWAGQRPLSWGHGAEALEETMLFTRIGRTQPRAGCSLGSNGRRETMPNKTDERCLIHALPIYLAQINEFFLCLGRGAGK